MRRARAAWQNCRGIGLSFGYNQVEDDRHLIDGPQLVRHLVDVVSRGGNLLLNVGPTAQGTIHPLQRRSLEQLGDWMAIGGRAIHGSRPLDPSIATPTNDPWVRWTSRDGFAYAIVEGKGETPLPVRSQRVDAAAATMVDGAPLPIRVDNGGVVADLPEPAVAGPVVVRLPVR